MNSLSMQMNLEVTMVMDQLPERTKHAIRRDSELTMAEAYEKNGAALRKHLKKVVSNWKLRGSTTIQTLEGEVTYTNMLQHPKVKARRLAASNKGRLRNGKRH